jgi:HD-GYP domain-containing protein (c-di-GMP phosphodiesterase class II)
MNSINTSEQASSHELKSVASYRDPWLVLESLLLQLSDTESTNHSVGAAVEAAKSAVHADVAYWFSKSSNKVSGMHADRSFTAEQAAQVAKQLLTRMPAGGESLRWVNPDAQRRESHPEAALIACDSRTQGAIVVLSFNPERRFDDGDTKAVRMSMKMLLAQRAQAQIGTKSLLNGLLHCLTTVIDAKDPYTSGHSERVARIAVLLVKEMGLGESISGDVYLAGLLHDVGKIGLRDEILQRPGKLSTEEMEEVRRHPVIGERIVASIRPFDRLRPAVRHHHEQFNGRGYPDGLAGENIPIIARILAVADACDAMMSPRRYRSARSPYEIDAVFNAESGRQFDPQVVRAFMAVRHEIYPPIYQKGIGESAFHAIGSIVDNLTEGSMMVHPPLKEKNSR